MDRYLFNSSRLGFRNWEESDLPALHEINNDEEVMTFFPRKPGKEESRDFIRRMQEQYKRRGFCYFAVEQLENREFIGFIGLSELDFEADFTPCIDIGWRLKRSAWHKGYASEGAKACLDFAFEVLTIEKVMAIAPLINYRSEAVMKKINMQRLGTFQHPKLLGNKRLRDCSLYEISSAAHRNNKKIY